MIHSVRMYNPFYSINPRRYSLREADKILMFGIYVGELYVNEQQDLRRANMHYRQKTQTRIKQSKCDVQSAGMTWSLHLLSFC